MNLKLLTRPTFLLTVIAGLSALPAHRAVAQTTDTAAVVGEIEAGRAELKADRKAVITEALQLTDQESAAFWPLYAEYRAAMDKVGDRLLKLILEYAKVYPNVPEDRAKELLKDYLALEKELPDERAWYMKKFTKILPASKALRFEQLENRLDLALRVQLASAIPLTPIEGRLTGSTALTIAKAQGVPGGIAVQTFELTAKVTAIDAATRQIGLLSPDGIRQTVEVGPGAVNFDQIQVGDQLKLLVAKEVVVAVAGEGETPANGGAGLVALAPVGAKPGGILAHTIQMTAKVIAIDGERHEATLQFEDGTTKTVPVRPDVDLGQRKVGDTVVIRVTQALAIEVEKP